MGSSSESIWAISVSSSIRSSVSALRLKEGVVGVDGEAEWEWGWEGDVLWEACWFSISKMMGSRSGRKERSCCRKSMDLVMVETEGWVVGELWGMTGGVSSLLTVLTRLVMAASMAATRCSRADCGGLRLGGGEGGVC